MSPGRDDETTDKPDEQNADETDEEQRRLIVQFAIPTDDFLLASTLETVPDIIVEFEQFVPADPNPLPYLWTTDDDQVAFEEAAENDPTVERFHRIAGFEQGALYEIDWNGLNDSDGLFKWLQVNDVTVLQLESTDDEWLLKLRVPSRTELSDLQEYCQTNDIHFRLVRLFPMTEPKMGQFNLSEKQRETLVTALEMGYFEIPRESTLDEIGKTLGISTNSASERLRRAQTNLVSNTVTIGQPTGTGINGDKSSGSQ